jgi:PII-like signaling protein
MEGFKQGNLLRIFVDEDDRHGAEPLYTAIVEFLRKRGIAGATVFRGIEGYGARRRVHIAQAFKWIPNLPILIEAVDDTGTLEAILPELETLVGEGLVTLEGVEYRRLRRAPSGTSC